MSLFFSGLFQINSDIYFVKKNNGFLLLGKNRKEVIELKDVSFVIWKNLKKPTSFESLLKKIKEEYDISTEELEEDLKNWLKKALKEKIIQQLI